MCENVHRLGVEIPPGQPGESPGDDALLVALAGVDGLGSRMLTMLLRAHGPAGAVAVIRGEQPPQHALAAAVDTATWQRWRHSLAQRDPHRCWLECVEHSIAVTRPDDPGFPAILRHDPRPPSLLFSQGDLGCLHARRVAVVGTRHPTRAGLDTAEVLGAELAAAGVVVVSGLARGIDGAVHRGVLRAGGVAVGIVANGLDRPYPAVHRRLWREVADSGAVISEWPPGVRPDAFRFPLRNRMIAALAEVVVVVESRERGGSMSTVHEATERGITVMAVPGSPLVRASAGTNRLLCEGAVPVTGVDDILVALGLDNRRARSNEYDSRRPLHALGHRIVALCAERPRTLDDIVVETELAIAAAALELARLERDGWLIETAGWFQIAGPWSAVPERWSGP